MKQFVKLSLLVFVSLLTYKSSAQNKEKAFEVKVTGKGAASIIFIPGFACAGDVWNDTKSKYENNFTCYTLTMAGFAGVPPQGTATFKEREQAIAAFIKEHKIKKAVIVGHSMGGAWAMALAADYPELVSKIVVVDALPCLPAVYKTDFKVKEPNDCSAVINSMSSMNDADFYKMQKRSMGQLVADTSKIEMLATWSLKSDRNTFASLYCDFMNTDLREQVAKVKCPAMILLEPSFEEIKPTINDQFSNMKTADIRYATSGLHFIMYDDKEWFEKQLNSFIP
jgi:pimeloyl-ACP methyl ester carboxylesterase